MDALEKRAPELWEKARVLIRGGGYINVYDQKKCKIFGKSLDYGSPPIALVERLLKPYASQHGYELLIQIDEQEISPMVKNLWEKERSA